MRKVFAYALVLFMVVCTGVQAGDYIRFQEGHERSTGQLQIAVEPFTKLDKEITIDLYGVVHMADKAYYRLVQKDLDKYDLVLYEGIKRGTKPNPETEMLNLVQVGMSKILGLQFQKEGISYTGKNMVHADIDVSTLERKLGGQSVPSQFAPKQLKRIKVFLDVLGAYVDLYFMQNPEVRRELKYAFARQLSNTDIEKQLSPKMRKAIITDRNQIVMNVLDEQLRKIRVVKPVRIAIFYGAGHSPDFAKRLTARGWKRGTKVWKTAWNIR